MSYKMKPALFAAILAMGALFAAPAPVSASPAASGLATSGVAGIAAEANQVTEVRRRGRGGYRHRGYRHRGYRRGYPGLYFGFGAAPFYYGYPYYYRRPYYAAPRYRRTYRGGGHCARAHRACVARWGYGGGNYIGCMRYERCRPR